MALEDLSRTEVLATLRQLFQAGVEMEREEALRALQAHYGWARLGPTKRRELESDIHTALLRGILVKEDGMLRLLTRALADYNRDAQKQFFLAAQDRKWTTRTEAIRNWARYLGFQRTGRRIQELGRSVINGLLREGRLERRGREEVRRV